jgi:regulator of CtrA degradation
MGITFGKFGSSSTKTAPGATISFGEHFAASDQFDAIFKHGMGLVERTASYLDGPGRKEAKALKPPLTLVYATESMRLTTRLLELASWLLIRRAMKDGELSAEDAALKRERVKLQPLGRPSHVKGYNELPEGLRELVDASFALNDRIVQLDRALQVAPEAQPEVSATNPVECQMKRISAAFAPRIVGGTQH